MASPGELPEEWLSFILAFVGGFADAAGLVLAKTFTGHITGNLVLAAVSLAAREWATTLIRLSAVASFLAGVLLSVAFAQLAAVRRWPPLLPAFAVEVVLITAGTLMLTIYASTERMIFVLCLSLALGLQNGSFRRAGGISVHTTYITGMITGLLVTHAENFFSTEHAPPPAGDGPASLIYRIWLTFFLGAAVGAMLTFRFKEMGMFGIVLILVALVVHTSIAARPAHA